MQEADKRKLAEVLGRMSDDQRLQMFERFLAAAPDPILAAICLGDICGENGISYTPA